VPGEETIEKMISKIRNQEPAPEENSWHLGTIAQYPLPCEALSTVLKVWADAIDQDKPFTIREALWVARLYHVFRDAGRLDNVALLIEKAESYALFERVFLAKEGRVLDKKGHNTRWLDAELIKSLYGDERPTTKVLSNISWIPITDTEAEELGLTGLFESEEEDIDARPHSQTVQG